MIKFECHICKTYKHGRNELNYKKIYPPPLFFCAPGGLGQDYPFFHLPTALGFERLVVKKKCEVVQSLAFAVCCEVLRSVQSLAFVGFSDLEIFFFYQLGVWGANLFVVFVVNQI
jgi:hypothetical protein